MPELGLDTDIFTEFGDEGFSPGLFVGDSIEQIDKKQQDLDAPKDEPSLLEGFKAGRRLEGTFDAVVDINERHRLQLDKDYKFPEPGSDEHKRVTEGIPQAFIDDGLFDEAFSAQHTEIIREQFLERQEAQKTLNELGGTGIALRISAAILDPSTLALAILTGGAANLAMKGNRLRRALKTGALASVENAAIETLIVEADAVRTPVDILYAALGGAALGGPIGALRKGEQALLDKAFTRVADRQDRVILKGAGIGSESHINRADVDAVLERAEFQRQLDIDAMPANRSVGAAQTRVDDPLVPEPGVDEIPDSVVFANAPKSRFTKARFSLAGRLGASNNPFVRFIADRLIEDNVGKVDGRVVGFTAELVANRLRQTIEATFYRPYNPAFKAWKAATGNKGLGARRKYNTEIIRAIREQDFSDPNIGKAAKSFKQAIDDLGNEAKDAGVKGFENITTRPDFVPRIIAKDKVRMLSAKYGKQMPRMIANAIRAQQPGLDAKTAEKVGKAYWQTIRRVSAGFDDVDRVFGSDTQDALRQMLRESGDIGEEAIEDIVTQLKPKAADAGAIARGKRRTLLDENTDLKMHDGEVVKFTDLLENDAQSLLSLYTRQVSGQVGLAQHGFKSRADFDRILNRARSHGDELGMATSDIDRDIRRLEFAYDAISGRPLESDPTSVFARTGRTLRDLNFVRVMNQVGFAQLAEIGNLLGIGGWRGVMQNIPEMGRFLGRVKETGEIPDQLSRELEELVGFGSDRLRHQVHTRYDALSPSGDNEPIGIFGERFDHGLAATKRFVTDISGMAPVNTVLHRMTTRVISQRFLTAALSGKRVYKTARLRQMGLEDADLEQINAALRKHAITENSGVTGRKLRSLNVEQWARQDPDSLDKFTNTLFRASRRVIQENDIGSMSDLMHSTTGKLMVQFRSFMINAWEKQLLNGIAARDLEAFQAFTMSMVFGGLAFVLQMQVQSVGRPDRKEFLAKRLNTASIAKAAFQRAAFASLIPAAVDTIWQTTYGDDPIFAYGRSTGLASNILLGNPTADLTNKAQQAIRGVIQSATRSDKDLSQETTRAIQSLFPLQNAIGVRNVMEAVHQQFPKRP